MGVITPEIILHKITTKLPNSYVSKQVRLQRKHHAEHLSTITVSTKERLYR